jgi:hypothetical protein
LVRVLQLGDRIGRPHVLFAAHAKRIFTPCVERFVEDGVIAKCRQMMADRFFRDFEHADAFDVGSGAGEIFVDHAPGKADGFENLRAGIGHVSRNAHLGHHLHQSLADGLDIVLYALLSAVFFGKVRLRMEDGFHRHAGVDGFGAVAGEQREMVHFARRTGLHHQAGTGAQSLADQMLVNSRQREQRGNSNMLRIDLAVRHDQDAVAGTHGIFGLRAQARQPGLDSLLAPGDRIGDVDLERFELAAGVVIDVADRIHLVEVEDGLAHFQAHRRIGFVDAQQVGLRPNKRHQRHDQVFADRIDRRVGHLRKKLLEIVVERLVLARQHCQGRIVAH